MVAQMNDQPETISTIYNPETVYEFAKYLYINLRNKGIERKML